MLSLSPASRRAVVCLAEAFALLPFQLAPLETAALQLQAAGMPVSPRTILQALQAAAVAA